MHDEMIVLWHKVRSFFDAVLFILGKRTILGTYALGSEE